MRFLPFLAVFCCFSAAFGQSFTYEDFHHADSLAIAFMEAGQYQEGLELTSQTSPKVAKTFGVKDTFYAMAIDREATFHFYLGQFAKAAPLLEQVLTIREEALGKEHPDVAAVLSTLSLVYSYQGFTKKAIPLSLRAVEIDKKVYGEEHENYSYSISGLGVLYHSIDEYQKAADCFLISLKIDEKILGEDHISYMGALLNMGVVYNGLGDYPKAYYYINKAFELTQKYLGLKHPQTLRTLSNLADLHNRIGNYDLALEYNQQAVKLIAEVLGDKHHNYATALISLGNNYLQIGDYKQAEKSILQALSVYENTFGKEHPNYPSVLSILSNVYIKMQRYQEAENIVRQALVTIEKTNGKYSSNYTYALGTLSDLYIMTEEYQKALTAQLETIPLFEHIFGKQHPNIANTYIEIATSYRKLKDHTAAITACKKALFILEDKFGKDHPRYAYALVALALVYEDLGEYEKVANLYQRAFEITAATYGTDSHLVTNSWLSLARFHNQKNPAFAHHFVTQALLANLKPTVDSTQLLSDLGEYTNLDNFWNKKHALYTLELLAKIQTHLYETTQAIEYKKQAVKTWQALANLSSEAQRNLIQQEDKMTAVKYANYAAVGGIKASQELYESTKESVYLGFALQFAEHNKSTVLNSTLYQQQALSLGGIPDSLVVLEKGLKKRIDELQINLEQAQKDKEKDKIASLQEELVQYTLEQTALQDHLIANYPRFNEIRQTVTAIDIQQVQTEILGKKTALLEYFIHDTAAYLIVVTPEDAQLIALSSISAIKKEVIQLRKSLTNYKWILNDTEKASTAYVQTATNLYQLLLQPISSSLTDIEHLIIVTDGSLGHIPFEVLLTSDWNQEKEVDFKKLPYLIKDYSISYSYSTSLLLQNKKSNSRQLPNNNQIIGFAASYPTYSDSDLAARSTTQQEERVSLLELPAVQKEVKAIESIFPKGAFFYQMDANEATFKQKAGDYAVIHLAMHGLLYPNQPLLSSLAFTENLDTLQDNFLTAQEITNLPLHSDLVVLSACETGFGKFEEGEGILSLARSFMYAGVPSLVVSLWQVNDASTAFIMQHFYENIAQGMTKDKALQTAKLTYLNSCSSNIAAHPAFWSPFIQLGDSSPIQVGSRSIHWIWWVLGISMLLLIGVGISKKYQTKLA